jgi:predicted nucleotidyltransferase
MGLRLAGAIEGGIGSAVASASGNLGGGPTREDLLIGLRGLRPALETSGVTGMALIGSRARGDGWPDSNIDVVIEVAESRKISLVDLVGVAQMIEDRFGLPASVFTRRSLDADFVAVVRNDEMGVF